MNPFKMSSERIREGVPVDEQSYESMRNYFAPRTISYESPIGCIGIVAADANNISRLFFTQSFPFDELPHVQVQYPVLTRVQELLNQYFAGESFDTSQAPITVDGGTRFQNEVWDAIQQIPHGEVRSYKWIAEQIGKPKTVRAVGSAVGANLVSIFVPCHRVIRSDGTLGGYGGGIERKRQLLALERYQNVK
jgi:methylated-DNA-[protein]-cysteine S-methyltransferase